MVRNIPLQLQVTVLDKLIAEIDMILGLDAIDWLGGATIAKGQVKLRNQYVTKMASGVNSNDTTIRGEIRVEFDKKVERWIDERILIPRSGKVEGILPLMAVVQPTKKKVRPVLDFRELNKNVAYHT